MQTEQMLAQFLEISEVKEKMDHCYYSEDINLFCPNIATSGFWAFADWLNGAWWMYQKTHQVNGNPDVAYAEIKTPKDPKTVPDEFFDGVITEEGNAISYAELKTMAEHNNAVLAALREGKKPV